MKPMNLILLAAVLSSYPFSSASAQPLPRPTIVHLEAEHVFAPPGFDNNDNVQIVIHGHLPNTCYKIAPPASAVNHSTRKVFVSAQAYHHPGAWCLQVVIPFTQTIDLGLLNPGSYRIFESRPNANPITHGVLPVGRGAGSGPDSILYLPVKTAELERGGSRPVLKLSGMIPANCIELDRVVVLRRDPKIFEVLPIARRLPGVECHYRPVPFDTRVDLPESASGDQLIHIRSMNGNSINLVETL